VVVRRSAQRRQCFDGSYFLVIDVKTTGEVGFFEPTPVPPFFTISAA
jgi:hypothetical protein